MSRAGGDQIAPGIDRRLAVILLLLVIGPLVVLLVWSLGAAERLPDPVSRHWSGQTADGFSSLPAVLWVTVAFVILLGLPFAVGAFVASEPPLRRVMAAAAAGLPVFLVALVADSLRVQLDLAEAAAAPPPQWGVAVGVVAGGAAALLGALLVRSPPRCERRAAAPPPTSLPRPADPGAVTWSARLPLSTAVLVVLVSAIVVMTAVAAAVGWGMFVMAASFAILLWTQVRLRASITPDEGLVVTGGGVFRLLRVPPDEVAEARVDEVDPWEFGGWGLRIDTRGRTGVITRKGPALHVVRGDGSHALVTVDDAEAAAAALNAAADLAHAGGRGRTR